MPSADLEADHEMTPSMRGSVHARIVRGAFLVGTFAVAVKLVAFGKEVMAASYFGRGDHIEAFLVAMLVPTLVAETVGGTFAQAFVPAYVRVKERSGRASADRLFSQCVVASLACLVVTAVVLYVAGPWVLRLVAGGFSDEKQQLALAYLRWLTPVCALQTLPFLFASVFHSQERFVPPAIAQVSVPAVTLVFLAMMGPSLGAVPLVAGVLVGFAVESSTLAAVFFRSGFRLGTGKAGAHPEFREVVRQWLPASGGMVLHNLTLLVDPAMAARLEPGGVAALSYAYRLVALPIGFASLAVGTAFLPVLSTLAGSGDWGGFWRTLDRWLRIALYGSLLPVLLLVWVARPLVELVFERGAFGQIDSAVVAAVLAAYAGMIPFYVAGNLGVKAIGVLGLNRVLVLIGAINLVANVVGNLVLSRWIGVSGIALATVCVYALSLTIILGILVSRRARGPERPRAGERERG